MDCFRQVAQWDFNPRSLAGATDRVKKLLDEHANFNPRSLTGATQTLYKRDLQLFIFQSTLPYGSDRQLGAQVWGIRQYFNPRSLTGATHAGSAFQDLNAISIHAPSRERLVVLY